jgi:Toluene-4-monooxygenase system protein B (TmoB)
MAGTEERVIPVYGFLEGDTIGLLILADEQEPIAATAAKVQAAARLRVQLDGPVVVVVDGQEVDPGVTVQQAGLKALDRIDVRRGRT